MDYYNYKMSGSEDESHAQPGMTKAELRRVNINWNLVFVKLYAKWEKCH